MAINSLAGVEAIEQIILEGHGIPANTYEALQLGAGINPHRIALRFFLQASAYNDEVIYTYEDLLYLVTQAANMFHDLGVGQDDVVSMLLPNIPQALFTLFGGQAAGIVNPMETSLSPEAIAEILQETETKVLVTMAPFPGADLWQRVEAIADDVPSLETILRVDLTHYLGRWHRWGAKWLNRRVPKPNTRAQVLDFGETARRYPPERLISQRIIRAGDVASYFAAGEGETAVYTHANHVYTAWAAAQNITSGDREADADHVFFGGLPLYRLDGYLWGALLPFSLGATLVLGTPLGFAGDGVAAHFWEIGEYCKISRFAAPAYVMQALLDVPVGEARLDTLEYAFCDGPLPPDVAEQLEAQTGARVLPGYWLPEASGLAAINPAAGERRPGSVGLRLPYEEMRLVVLGEDGRYQRDCQPNETGAIILRGPNIFQGYINTANNEDLWLDIGDGRGDWLLTGAAGRLDADGYLYFE